MKRIQFFSVIVLSLIINNSAHSQPLMTGPATTVTASDVEAEVSPLPKLNQKSVLTNPARVAQVANNIYLRRGFAKIAMDQKLNDDPLVAAQLKAAQDKVLSDALLTKLETSSIPSEAATLEWAKTTYRAEPKRFETPPQVRASHILILGNESSARLKAEQILADLKNGGKFEDLAKAHSADKGSAEEGGDLGFFAAGRMVKPFDEAVFGLARVGDISDIVVTQFGYHIIKLTGKRPAGLRTFDEVKETLLKEATNKLRQRGREIEAEKLLKDAKLDVNAVETFTNLPR